MHEPNANVNADRVPRSGHLGNVLTLSAVGGASLSGSCTTPCHDQSVPTIDAAGMGIRAASDRFVEYHGVSITCAGLALGHSRALTRAGADARTFTQIRSPTTDAPPPAGCGPAANAAGTRTAIAPTPTAAVPSRRRLVKPTPDLVTSKLPPPGSPSHFAATVANSASATVSHAASSSHGASTTYRPTPFTRRCRTTTWRSRRTMVGLSEPQCSRRMTRHTPSATAWSGRPWRAVTGCRLRSWAGRGSCH